jgi:hypothetical protein
VLLLCPLFIWTRRRANAASSEVMMPRWSVDIIRHRAEPWKEQPPTESLTGKVRQ